MCWILGGRIGVEHWCLIWLPVCSYVTFFLCWAFPRKSQEKAERKVTPSEEPQTRTTKQSSLFPPSNKGVGTTHPNYISATCHEWHSRVAKINHIQKPECWAVVTRYCQLVYLHREAKRLPQSDCCWWARTDLSFPSSKDALYNT